MTRIVQVVKGPSSRIVQIFRGIGAKGDRGDSGTGGGAAARITGEVPSGVVNGANATFFLAFDPVPESVEVFYNGIRQKIIQDFQISSNQIQFNFSPESTATILVNYTRA